MTDFDKIKISGCEHVIGEMKAISEDISGIEGRQIQFNDKIATLKKEVKTALQEQNAAHEHGDRQAYEQAFDKRGSLLEEIATLEKEKVKLLPHGLMSRYETVRRMA